VDYRQTRARETIVKFKLVSARTSGGLEEGVNEMLEDGWELHGVTMMASTPVGDGSVVHEFVQAIKKDTNLHE
jgi:hypothetical protein